MIGGSDAAEHEDLRAADGAGREDHLFAGQDFVHLILALEQDTVGLVLFVDQDPVDVRVHGDVQVGPLAHRSQEGLGRRTPVASAHRS